MFGIPLARRNLAACIRDVHDSRPKIRADAIADFAFFGEENREQVLVHVGEGLSDASAIVRRAAASTLADLRAGELLAPLLFAVEDDDALVRQLAITALGEIGDARARSRLVRALSDPRPEVRFQAVIAYVRVAPDDATDRILDALSDSDPKICHIALRAAEELADSAGLPIAESVLAKARELVTHPENTVRVAAAIVLARSGDLLGEQILAEVVNGTLSTSDAEDEACAVTLAGEIPIAAAVVGLRRRAFGFRLVRRSTFAWQALVSLARQGDGEARRRILRELGSSSRDRRTLAVAAAGQARMVEAKGAILALHRTDRGVDPQTATEALSMLDRVEQEPPSPDRPSQAWSKGRG